jgi:hypothetical protein
MTQSLKHVEAGAAALANRWTAAAQALTIGANMEDPMSARETVAMSWIR